MVQKLPHDRYGNVSVEFTAPVWSEEAGERVDFWYVGVFQDGRISEAGEALIRRISLRAVQECVSAEYSNFAVASEEDFYKLTVGGDFTSSTAKFAMVVWHSMFVGFFDHNGMNFTTETEIMITIGSGQIVHEIVMEVGGTI